MDSYFKSGHESGEFCQKDQDLLLAAEIGKSLLERNRELESILKSAQDYTEEQTAQVDFYYRQVELLRESNESLSHTCEQLELNNQQLLDKYEQQKAEYKILQGKNNRFWELVNSLEKKNEELLFDLNNLKAVNHKEKSDDESTINKIKENVEIHVVGDVSVPRRKTFTNEEEEDEEKEQLIVSLRLENENLLKLVSELNVIVKVDKWSKEEMEAQIEDIVNENQVLHHKISNLHQEIREWENFAEKEENYRRIADAFSAKHNIESEAEYEGQLISISPNSRNNLSKAKSCEFLNTKVKEEHKILKTPNLVNNVLSSVNSSSFLSELDSEYADLVKRYEALLEKCKQEGKFNENPERTRKVQRAIQTLSFDFTKLVSSVTSPSPSKESKTILTDAVSTSTTVSSIDKKSCSCETSTCIDVDDVDYRKMFADIFAKIKESKEC